MGDGLYVAMSAATARTRQLDAVADVLANAQTPGFLADRTVFEVTAPGPGAPLPHVVTVDGGVDATPGTPTSTGRPLDVMLEHGTFLQVLLPDGTLAHTRNGSLQVRADGLVTTGGHAVRDEDGAPLVLPPGTATVHEDGSVWVNGREAARLQVDRLDGTLRRVSSHAVRADAAAAPVVPHLAIGQLEMPRQGALAAAVQMVNVQRQFENATQAMQAYRRLDQVAGELGRVR
ncbi:MAG: flagellar hook basal-body protein [Deltaproteobacteria bacterium]|nr:flagellar hook basal-body protein [Deltaproteobacteria bacterium]